MIPELPSYLDSIGGGEYKGLIIALFTVTAGLSRPFSGKLADKVGRIPVMVVGAVVSGVAALFYPLISGVVGFFALRLFHGFSTGFKPTGTSAYIADLVPVDRRGEAMGVIGFFSSLGMAAGPSIGGWVASEFTLNMMFYTSSAFAVSSVAILIGMKETLQAPKKFSAEYLKIKADEVFEPKVIPASINMGLSVFSFGAILTVVPDLSDSLGVSNRGQFFTFFTFSSLLIRLLAGKVSDKYGRIPVLKAGGIVVFLALIIMSQVDTYFWFVVGGILFGIGVGLHSPTVFAWTVDLSDEKHRGRGIATMYIALEIGIGVGASMAGWVFANEIQNIEYVFYMSAFSVLMSFLYLYSKPVRRLKEKKHE